MISFSAITDKPKTNPLDISDWYITNSILKDPPKGIYTKRIYKVGENNELLQATADSCDRNDAIMQFARNTNPMVSVQYNNVGEGFGRGGNNEAFLPYRIMKDGAFRPPIIDQRDLLPLSRLPRYVTSANTSKECIDYSKGIRPSEDALKRNEVLNSVNVIPMCTNKCRDTKTGIDQPYDITYHIDNKPQRIKQHLHNSSVNVQFFREDFDGVIEGSSGRIPTYKVNNVHQDFVRFKTPPNFTVQPNISGLTKHNINTLDRHRDKNIPSYSMNTIKSHSYLQSQQIKEPVYTLNPKREHYSFQNNGVKPMTIDRSLALKIH